MRKILLVLPQSGNEVYFSTILRILAQLGYKLHIISLTDGRNGNPPDLSLFERASARALELEKAAEVYGGTACTLRIPDAVPDRTKSPVVFSGGLQDHRLMALRGLQENFEFDLEFVLTFDPSYFPHPDHQLCAQIARTAFPGTPIVTLTRRAAELSISLDKSDILHKMEMMAFHPTQVKSWGLAVTDYRRRETFFSEKYSGLPSETRFRLTSALMLRNNVR